MVVRLIRRKITPTECAKFPTADIFLPLAITPGEAKHRGIETAFWGATMSTNLIKT
jgi:hypothetical protein